jgi:hypothetical protein
VSNDFYEDDEPIEKIKAIFNGGEKVSTARPHGQTVYVSVDADGMRSRSGPNTTTT